MMLRAPIVGWFHLGNEEAAKAREFLRLCNGEDSVDELGFGVLRDGFSDEFFPGTSTVMTEVRYLIFVAAIYRSMERTLERKKAAIPDLYRRSRQMQDQLRDVLAATFGNKRGFGVIGISAKEPERYPSAIYWASMRTLGILRRIGATEGDYLSALSKHHEQSRFDENSGDPVAEAAPPPVNWDRHFPYYNHDPHQGASIVDQSGRFATGLDFNLTIQEARYLRDCYLGIDTVTPPASGIHRSLLAHLIEKSRKTSFSFPWDVKPPPHLEMAVDDARHFSVLVRGAMLQYYYWLIKARREEQWEIPNANIDDRFAAWWSEGRPMLMKWDQLGFLERRKRYLRPHRNDAGFMQEWLRQLRAARSSTGFLISDEARTLIVQRERTCKPRKARLSHKKHLQSWNRVLPESDPIYQLDFRARIGNTFVHRIVKGLESGATAAVEEGK